MSRIFPFLICSGLGYLLFMALLGLNQVAPEALLVAWTQAGTQAIDVLIKLMGALAIFLGFTEIANALGLMQWLADKMSRPLRWLFPSLPNQHEAFSPMTLNIGGNLLGLGNAATPFGIQGMQALSKQIDSSAPAHTATPAMTLFVAMNTAAITLVPTKVMALRAIQGSETPSLVMGTTLFATLCSTVVAIIAAHYVHPQSKLSHEGASQSLSRGNQLKWLVSVGTAIVIGLALVLWLSEWIMPILVFVLMGLAYYRRVDAFEAFVRGAKLGLETGVRIAPYLIAALFLVSTCRVTGLLDGLVKIIAPVTNMIGLPAEVLPMALLRPLTGSGAFGYLTDLLAQPATGPDSYAGLLASTLMGSTETTFYVLAVYMGAANIRSFKPALIAGLIADVSAVFASIVACQLVWRWF